jgi:hypothetical protein
MKAFITLLALFSVQAFAETELESGDLKLSAAHAQIISVSPICPRTPGGISCMAIGSTIKVKVFLNGCLDRLGGYSSKVELVDGKAVLYFSAINIATEASEKVRCIQQASKMVSIYTTYEGPVELVNLDFTGAKSNF